MIQEYRKASARALALDTYLEDFKLLWRSAHGNIEWQPDQDHDQMAMIEDKLIEEDLEIKTNSYKGYKYGELHEITGRVK